MITETAVDPAELLAARENPNGRRVFHVTISVHPDAIEEDTFDLTVFDRVLGDDDDIYANGGALYIRDRITGTFEIYPAGTWGVVKVKENIILGNDGSRLSDSDFIVALFQMNELLDARRRDAAQDLMDSWSTLTS